MSEGRRILLVSTSMARGGAERQVVDLASSLRSRGWRVAVLSMTTPSDHIDELAASDVELVSLNIARGRPTPGALLRYWSFVRSWRPDVIHSHMVHANLLARVGRLLVPSIPVVCTVHSVMEGRRWRMMAYRFTDRLASATTAVSHAAAERSIHARAVPRARMVVVPNGFDFLRTRVAERAEKSIRQEFQLGDRFVWVSVGRLVPEKGHDALLRAFDVVRRRRPDVRLVIVGDGPRRSALDQLVTDLGLEGQAILLGERRDVPAILTAADAFVLSSRWEGLPMVLLEAAAQRLPIVSTDVGGCREVAKPDLGAVLTGTRPEAIAAGMLRIMSLSADQRAAVGQDLRAFVEAEFNLDTIVGRWEQLYARVMTHA